MVILACGSRNWTSYSQIYQELAQYENAALIHGGARGADELAGRAGEALRWQVLVVPADWNKYGRRAGFVRNVQMLDMQPDLVIAFWDGKSRGTEHTIREAKARGIEVRVVREELG